MATALADRVIVFRGNPGVECTAGAAEDLVSGMNKFLKSLDVTLRRDPDSYVVYLHSLQPHLIECCIAVCSFRPRVNKKNSTKDKEQKASGQYYMVDESGDTASRAKASRRT